MRGIEWSLRAFASMRARAVISFVMRAASTLKITNDEQRSLRKAEISLYLKNVVLRQVIWLTLSKRDNRGRLLGNMIKPYRGSTIPSCLQPIMPCLICRLLQNYFTQLHESQWVDAKRDLNLSKVLFTSKQVRSQEVQRQPAFFRQGYPATWD